MDFFRYFMFYFRLAGARILLLVLITAAAAGAQGLAMASMLPVLNFSNLDVKSNRIIQTVQWGFNLLQISDRNTQLLVMLCVSASLFLCGGLALLISKLVVAKIETDLFAGLQVKTVRRLFDANYEYYASKNTGHLVNALQQQMLGVINAFGFFGTIITGFFFAVLFLGMPFVINWKMALMAVAGGIVYLPFMKLVNRKSKHFSIMNSRTLGDLGDILIQILSNYKYLKSTNSSASVIDKLKDSIGKYCYCLRRIALWNSFSSDAVLPCAILYIYLILYIQISYFNVSIQDALMLMAFLYMAYQKGIVVPTAYQKFLYAAGSITIYEELDKELCAEQEKWNGTVKPNFSGSIEFKDVSFTYRNSSKPVLNKLSLEIRPFTTVAFVGGSGSGKSTIVNMLAGLLVPQDGKVSLFSVDYKDLDIAALRSSIGYVTQEPVIFNDSAASNISLWNRNITFEQIKDAAKKARADEFILKMENGYDSMLGDKGIVLSGGQRQRITIAREILRDSRLLILDEATSALDSETEEIIRQSIDALHGRQTVVIIAHRLSTIRNCDMIFVLDEGRIVESGSYEELYNAKGRFREMAERQNLGSV